MKLSVLVVHNYYREPGGEDIVFQAEKALLERAGHDVLVYERHNQEITGYGALGKLMLPKRTVWAGDSLRAIREILKRERPQVVHFHNTFPLISPSAYYAARSEGAAVVQSLHNPRLLCPAASFYRDEHVCEDCLGKTSPWPSVVHACYRGSRAQTAVVAAMLTVHRLLKTWQKAVDVYVAFTEFYRRKFIEGGLPPEKITVKPHFVHPDPGLREQDGNYALFMGRLSPEKGVRTLLNAWQLVKGIPLKIRGDGPLLKEVQDFVAWNRLDSTVEVVGHLPREEMFALIKGARFLVWPSEGHYETFGLVSAEAFACGVPVLASRLGVMAEIVEDKRTGLNFAPGDPADLAARVKWAWTHPHEMQRMGMEARREYEKKYTAEQNYSLLMQVYERAMEVAKEGRP